MFLALAWESRAVFFALVWEFQKKSSRRAVGEGKPLWRKSKNEASNEKKGNERWLPSYFRALVFSLNIRIFFWTGFSRSPEKWTSCQPIQMNFMETNRVKWKVRLEALSDYVLHKRDSVDSKWREKKERKTSSVKRRVVWYPKLDIVKHRRLLCSPY